jgi:hypothetical protein
MTDPDETTQHQTRDPGDPGAPVAPRDPVTARDPGDPTVRPAASGATPDDPGSSPATGGATLRVDPDRRSDPNWREPPWFPPRDRDRGRDRPSSGFAIVVGLILIAIGAWYFLDRTLGLAMPRIQWGSLWPLILILIGGWILVRSFQRRA